MDLCLRAATDAGLTNEEMLSGLMALLKKHPADKVLIIPPD